MINFKNAITQAKQKMEYLNDESSIEHNNEDDQNEDEEEKAEVNKIVSNIPRQDNNDFNEF
jgi:hypothetical protein